VIVQALNARGGCSAKVNLSTPEDVQKSSWAGQEGAVPRSTSMMHGAPALS
jgi:hypothetical protein